MKKPRFTEAQISRGIEGRRSGSAGGAVDAQARHQRGEWCKEQDIELRFIQPVKPDQNGPTSSASNGPIEKRFRAHTCSTRWKRCGRSPPNGSITPHDALGSLPPAHYRERLLAAETPAWNCLLEGGAYGQIVKKGNNGAETRDSAVTNEFLSCESGWSKTIRRPL